MQDCNRRTIIFDLDDTLVVEEESARAAFLAACELANQRIGVDPQELHAAVRAACRAAWHASPARAYCVRIGISSWEGLWAEFRGTDNNLRILREWAPEYRERSWHHALCQCGVDNRQLALELADTYVIERRKRHLVYSNVLPVLTQLRQSYCLGLLTNGVPDLQRRKIDGAGLNSFFEMITISGEVGMGKPDAEIFEHILMQLHTTPVRAIMVGNSLQSDIQPAQTIGMTTIWVNRDNNANDGTITPDFEINDLAALREVLE